MSSTPSDLNSVDLPRWLWLWFPPLILVAHAVTWVMGEDVHRSVMSTEFGLVEVLTFSFLVTAVVLALLSFARRRTVDNVLFSGLMLMMAAGCVYFGGEEVSWGYHWGVLPLGEELSGDLMSTNDQGEPNLHNQEGLIGSLLDQLPRSLLGLAAFVGGILMPLLARKRKVITWPTPWVWPTIVCLPTCALAVLITQPKHILKALDKEVSPLWKMGETKEYFLALFLMLYFASIYRRLRAVESKA